ncbi:MAG: hypothetical protein LBP61_08720 [Desulfovibrio sp.]|nr:hypothetical protein [Desulfovibrio sp.]
MPTSFTVSLVNCPDTKLHSNSFECKTPKFLKNRQSLLFQKLAGNGFASALPISFLLKANWHEPLARGSFTTFAASNICSNREEALNGLPGLRVARNTGQGAGCLSIHF